MPTRELLAPSQRVLGRETVDVQHIGCIARPAGVHYVEGIPPAAEYA